MTANFVELLVAFLIGASMIVGAALFALGWVMGNRARQRDELLRELYADLGVPARDAARVGSCRCYRRRGGASRPGAAPDRHARWCPVRVRWEADAEAAEDPSEQPTQVHAPVRPG